MKQYLDLLKLVLENGDERKDRTGVGTIGVFGAQARFDLRESFPLLTTKKLHLRSIIYELLWFLKGDTNIKYLNDNRVTIWDEWADKNGDLGRIYGAQWTDWRTPDGGSVNQIKNLIDGIKKDPFGRRHIVSAWNPGEIKKMALPPCHALFQFYVSPDGGRSFQHSFLRDAHNDGCAGVRFEAERICAYIRGFAHIQEPFGAGKAAAFKGAEESAFDEAQSRSQKHRRFCL